MPDSSLNEGTFVSTERTPLGETLRTKVDEGASDGIIDGNLEDSFERIAGGGTGIAVGVGCVGAMDGISLNTP